MRTGVDIKNCERCYPKESCSTDGKHRVVFGTVALGMGIDLDVNTSLSDGGALKIKRVVW